MRHIPNKALRQVRRAPKRANASPIDAWRHHDRTDSTVSHDTVCLTMSSAVNPDSVRLAKEALLRGLGPARAAAAAGVGRATLYRWRDKIPSIRDAWDNALIPVSRPPRSPTNLTPSAGVNPDRLGILEDLGLDTLEDIARTSEKDGPRVAAARAILGYVERSRALTRSVINIAPRAQEPVAPPVTAEEAAERLAL